MKDNEISLIKLLNMNLIIPEYQRPYEWTKTNVLVLLDDIQKKYKNKSSNGNLNIGTIILKKNSDGFEIVDGLQRIITLSLLIKLLDNNLDIKILNKKMLCTNDSQMRVIDNFHTINEFIDRLKRLDNLNVENYYNFIKNNVSFYVLKTTNSEEAFQLFDGRNSKYRDLTPVDLLKAYHLGEITNKISKEDLKKIFYTWNKNIHANFSIDDTENKIDYLYNNILFNIYNWSLNKNVKVFSKKDIFLYKGFKDDSSYNYVNFYKSINNDLYQVNKPFKAGVSFFEMTSYYINVLDNLIKENDFKITLGDLYDNNKSQFKYINYVYYCALLMFFDKYGNKKDSAYVEIVKDYIYKWSLIHRIKNKVVNINSINHYVLGNNNFFFECNNSLDVKELLSFSFENKGDNPNNKEILGELRSALWKKLN